MAEEADRSLIGLVEAIERARRAGDEIYRQFLEQMLEEQRRAKWSEVGVDHRLWRRNEAILRSRHMINRDPRLPWPLENWAWSLQEGTRPIWGDNPPRIQIVPLKPGEDRLIGAQIVRAEWEWAAEVGQFDETWEELFDPLPGMGTTGLKVVWDDKKNAPAFKTVDPRAIFASPEARLHHRYARVLTLAHRVDIGEVKEHVPRLAERVQPVRDKQGVEGSGFRAVDIRRDTGITYQDHMRGAREEERLAEVVEMWINEDLPPLDRKLLEAAEEEANLAERIDEGVMEEFPSLEPLPEAPEKFLVVTFLPGAGVVNEERVVTGRQIFTGQFWRNKDSIFGISDVDVIAGIIIAADQLSIRGHAHRLAMFAPPFVNPKNSGIPRRHLSGRPAPILEPTDHIVREGLGYIEVPGPNREAVEYLLSRPQIIRRILGTDEIRPELFEREQTASGLALLVSALENRLRQKIRNLRPLVKDCVATTLRLIHSHAPSGFTVRNKNGDIIEVTREMMNSINLDDYAILTSLDRPGPLSKQARLASIERAIQIGVLDPNNGMPMIVREMLLDELEVPRRDEIKVEFQRIEMERQAQVAAAQQIAEQQLTEPSGIQPESFPNAPPIRPATPPEIPPPRLI